MRVAMAGCASGAKGHIVSWIWINARVTKPAKTLKALNIKQLLAKQTSIAPPPQWPHSNASAHTRNYVDSIFPISQRPDSKLSTAQVIKANPPSRNSGVCYFDAKLI